jgi:hypothetical protein
MKTVFGWVEKFRSQRNKQETNPNGKKKCIEIVGCPLFVRLPVLNDRILISHIDKPTASDVEETLLPKLRPSLSVVSKSWSDWIGILRNTFKSTSNPAVSHLVERFKNI